MTTHLLPTPIPLIASHFVSTLLAFSLRMRRVVSRTFTSRRLRPSTRGYFGLVAAILVIASVLAVAEYVPGQDPVRKAAALDALADDWHEQVETRLKAIEEGLADFELPAAERETLSVDRLREVVPQLRAPGQWVVDHFDSYSEAATNLVEVLQDTVPVLHEAATQHRADAAAADHELIAKQLMGMAEEAERLAEDRIAEAEANKAELSQVREKVEYVRESLVVLTKVEQFLDLYPTRERVKVTAYLRNLNAYLESYENTLKTFKLIRQVRDTSDDNDADTPQA